MRMSNIFVRPSEIVRHIEDGFVGAGQLIGVVAKATALQARDYGHSVSLEYQARREYMLRQRERKQQELDELRAVVTAFDTLRASHDAGTFEDALRAFREEHV